MRTWTSLAVVVGVLALLGPSSASADKKKKPGKGFYKVLVTPNAKWVLKGDPSNPTDTVVVETYDVRKVGSADVARIRWKHGDAEDTTSVDNSGILPTQVAVTSKGLYLLKEEDDDATIARTLATKKPSRSDPPKAYKGTKLNEGRYVTIAGGRVCLGYGPEPHAPECEDVCYAELCLDDAGVQEISGWAAPGQSMYTR